MMRDLVIWTFINIFILNSCYYPSQKKKVESIVIEIVNNPEKIYNLSRKIKISKVVETSISLHGDKIVKILYRIRSKSYRTKIFEGSDSNNQKFITYLIYDDMNEYIKFDFKISNSKLSLFLITLPYLVDD